MRMSSLLALAILLSVSSAPVSAERTPDGFAPYEAGSMYLGAAPRLDLEPYDNLETNAIPITLGWRPMNGTSWEVRPVLELRLGGDSDVRATHFGAATAFHLHPWHGERLAGGWFSPFAGPFLAGRTHFRTIEDVVTAGIELGAAAWSSRSFSIGLAIQPGIQIYTRTPVPGRTVSPRLGISSRFGWQF